MEILVKPYWDSKFVEVLAHQGKGKNYIHFSLLAPAAQPEIIEQTKKEAEAQLNRIVAAQHETNQIFKVELT